MKIDDKLFIIRKYIIARSASEAIKKDKTTEVSEVYMSEDFGKISPGASAIGFTNDRE
jgi:hypothetical protein